MFKLPMTLGWAGVMLCAAIACSAPRRSEPEREALEEPIRVLLLGDSISIGYTPVVQALLGERALVQHARKANGEDVENCQGTNHGVVHLERWLGQAGGPWDVIYFNFGLHDLKRVDPETGKNSNAPNDPYQADPARYEAQLRSIVARLQETGARLVFGTTTPVPDGVRPYRAPTDPVEYNTVARQVMREHRVSVHDLFSFAEPRRVELQIPNNVHFNETGSAALGREVARAILNAAGLDERSLPSAVE